VSRSACSDRSPPHGLVRTDTGQDERIARPPQVNSEMVEKSSPRTSVGERKQSPSGPRSAPRVVDAPTQGTMRPKSKRITSSSASATLPSRALDDPTMSGALPPAA